MTSNYESFFTGNSFAVIGHTQKKAFPKLTYRGLKNLGKKVLPIDPSVSDIDGDKTYPDLNSLPEEIDRVVIELPKEDTRDWVEKAAEKGVKDIWIHMACDTPEALQLAAEKNINVRTGTCAVMYVTPGFTYHSIHKWIMKLVGKY